MGMGGLSGPAVRPVALAMTYRVCRATELPVVGLGGIATWKDAAEFLLVGATAVQVGTALFSNPRAMNEIRDGLAQWCARHGCGSVTEMIGSIRSGDLIVEGVRE
jgi:dihydroorotate dehydrogenase (NAD+) catalytic subunit